MDETLTITMIVVISAIALGSIFKFLPRLLKYIANKNLQIHTLVGGVLTAIIIGNVVMYNAWFTDTKVWEFILIAFTI